MSRLLWAFLACSFSAVGARADEPLCSWARASVATLDARGGQRFERTLVDEARAVDAITTMNEARATLTKCFADWAVRDRRGHAALGDTKELAIESKTRGIYLSARGVPDHFVVAVEVR